VGRRFAGPGPEGRDVTHGVNVHLVGPNARREIAVWYSLRSTTEADMRPRQAVQQFLDDELPPEHILVTRGSECPVLARWGLGLAATPAQ